MKTLSRPLLLGLAVIAVVSWGGSWPAGKILAPMAPPEVLTFWRFFIVSISFIPLITLSKKSFLIPRKTLWYLLTAGLALALYFKLFFLGLREGLAGMGSVIVNGFNPLFLFFGALLFFKKPIHGKSMIGLLIGIAGGLILFKAWHFEGSELFAPGNLYFLTDAAVLAVATVLGSKAQKYMPSLTFNFYAYSMVAVLMFFIALFQGGAVADWSKIIAPLEYGYLFWGGILYMSLIATTFGLGIYFFTVKRLGARQAGAFTFLAPVSAVVLSWIVVAETPQISTIIGGSMAIAGVYLINKDADKEDI